MYRFTIRDVLWLIALSAMGLGWLIQVQAIQSRLLRKLDEQTRQSLRYKELVKQYMAEVRAAQRMAQNATPDENQAGPEVHQMTTRFEQLDKALAARGWRYDQQSELFMDGERQLELGDVAALVVPNMTPDELASYQDDRWGKLSAAQQRKSQAGK